MCTGPLNYLRTIAFISTLLGSLLLSDSGYASNDDGAWAVQKVGGDAVLDSARWCGESAIVWQALSGGIYIGHVGGNRAKKVVSNREAENPFCSPDGRDLFFTVRSVIKAISVDRNTMEPMSLTCLTRDTWISPEMDRAFRVSSIGGCNSIELPSKKTLQIEFIPTALVPGFYSPTFIGLDPNASKLLLRYKKRNPDPTVTTLSFRTLDLHTGALSTPIDVPESTYLEKIHPIEPKVYFMSRGQSIEQFDLYGLDYNSMNSLSTLIRRDIHRYDISKNGTWALLLQDAKNKRRLWISKEPNGRLTPSVKMSWDSNPRWSANGTRVLVMKQDPLPAGTEGPEGPPPTSTVYILNKR